MKKILSALSITALLLGGMNLDVRASADGAPAAPAYAPISHQDIADFRAAVETLNEAERARQAAFAEPAPNPQEINSVWNQAKDKDFLGFFRTHPQLLRPDIMDAILAVGFMQEHHQWAEFNNRRNFKPIDRIEYMTTFYNTDERRNPMLDEYIRRLEVFAQ